MKAGRSWKLVKALSRSRNSTFLTKSLLQSLVSTSIRALNSLRSQTTSLAQLTVQMPCLISRLAILRRSRPRDCLSILSFQPKGRVDSVAGLLELRSSSCFQEKLQSSMLVLLSLSQLMAELRQGVQKTRNTCSMVFLFSTTTLLYFRHRWLMPNFSRAASPLRQQPSMHSSSFSLNFSPLSTMAGTSSSRVAWWKWQMRLMDWMPLASSRQQPRKGHRLSVWACMRASLAQSARMICSSSPDWHSWFFTMARWRVGACRISRWSPRCAFFSFRISLNSEEKTRKGIYFQPITPRLYTLLFNLYQSGPPSPGDNYNQQVRQF